MQPIHCKSSCIWCMSGDNAIRLVIQSKVLAAAIKDVSEASVADTCVLPQLYVKLHYCMSYAIHAG